MPVDEDLLLPVDEDEDELPPEPEPEPEPELESELEPEPEPDEDVLSEGFVESLDFDDAESEPDEPLVASLEDPFEEPRLSVLKKPLPRNVTPTGWKTFFTGSRRPDSGCSYSVRLSSAKDCRTSTVSPESMNL